MDKRFYIFLPFLLMALVALPACTQPTVPTPTTPPEVKPPSVTTPTTEPEPVTTPESVTAPAAEPEPAEVGPPLEEIEESLPPGEEEAPPPEEVEPVGELLAEQTVSAIRGGTITTDDGGITVKFPPFSLNEDTNIQVRVKSDEEIPEDTKAVERVGEVYSLEPDGLEFIKPAVITFSLDRGDLASLNLEEGQYPLFIMLTRNNNGEWDVMDNMSMEVDPFTDEVTVSGEVSHFTDAVVAPFFLDVTVKPRVVSAEPGGSWYGYITLKNNHPIADISIYEIRYTTDWLIVKVEGPTKGSTFVLTPGSSQKTSPDPLYVCVKPGAGYYGAAISFGSDWKLAKVLEDVGRGRLFPVAQPEGVEAKKFSYFLIVAGSCECTRPCFAADTLVLMADDSLKRIGEIQAGELVKTYDTGTGEVMIADVVVTGSGEADHYYLINGDLKVTPPHPFYTDDGKWVKIADLKVGDEIRSVQGLVEITSIERVDSGQRIFNISVRDYHNFFVSANGEDFYLVREGP